MRRAMRTRDVCGAGQTCVEGECVCPDETRPSFCENTGCFDLTTDRANWRLGKPKLLRRHAQVAVAT